MKNKIALVTEGGNGLGKTLAYILKREGFEVVLAAKGNSYHELDKVNLDGVKLLKTDFTDPKSVEKLHHYIEQAYGKLDVLINNAEMANGFGQKIDELKIEDVKEIYEENFFAVMRVTQHLHNLLLKSGNATVVNVSSSLGKIEKMKDEEFCYANYQMIGYSTAKAALEMLTVVLAREFKYSNIRIASFDPVRLHNCTHNTVALCKEVEKEFLKLFGIEYPVKVDSTEKHILT